MADSNTARERYGLSGTDATDEFYSDLVDQGGEDGTDAIFPRKGAASARPPRHPSEAVPGAGSQAAAHRAATLDNTKANAGRPLSGDETKPRAKRPGDPRR